MMKALLPLLPLMLCLSGPARAGDMKPLDDEALGQVSARDGRMSMGFGGDGAYRYVVLKNVRGVVDLVGVHIDVAKKPDGADYVAVTLPGYVKFTNLGFESLSVQSDPLAPVTSSMGSVNINGAMNMQGQLRIWAH
jgi:hypothetical protein